MKTGNDVSRRNFFKSGIAGGLTAGLASTGGAVSTAFASPPKITITGMNFVRLKFPGRTPRKRNAILWSGGGQPGMTILEIQTDQGIVGRSLPSGSTDLIESKLARVIKGENPFYVEYLWDKMYRSRKPVAKGLMIRAIGSVDLAIWDIIGKALDMPVYRAMGGFRDTIRVYAAGGYYREDKSIADLAKELEEYVDEGFRAVKMKVGGEDFRTDVERVRVAREAIGPDIDLLIDANNKWNAYEAIRFGRAVEKYDLYWFEEPVEPDDFAGCAEVRQALDIPIVAGENEFTRWGCRDLLEARSADILNLDTVLAGGPTEYRKIAALASAYHVPVAPHGNPFMAVHVLGSVSNGLIMETYPGVQHQYNPALPLFQVKDGFVKIPDTPGLGIDIAPDILKKYQV
jgi:L-alanine-DL-glutamate epimerase-like enolase superfamily enzyme